MKPFLTAAVIFAAAAFQTVAAQERLKMVGTWKGEATAAHLGANPYRDTTGSKPSMPSAILEFTFAITAQQGNRFVGTSSAGSRSETIIKPFLRMPRPA